MEWYWIILIAIGWFGSGFFSCAFSFNVEIFKGDITLGNLIGCILGGIAGGTMLFACGVICLIEYKNWDRVIIKKRRK